MKKNSILKKPGAIFCSIILISNVYANSPQEKTNIEYCQENFSKLNDKSNEVKYVKKILQNNIHIGLTAHQMYPHKKSNYEDVIKAKNSLNKNEIPALIYLVINEKELAVQILASNVLVEFGTDSKNCIDNLLLTPKYKNNIKLQNTQTDIITNTAK